MSDHTVEEVRELVEVLIQARLLAQKWIRSSDPRDQLLGADLLQVLGGGEILPDPLAERVERIEAALRTLPYLAHHFPE